MLPLSVDFDTHSPVSTPGSPKPRPPLVETATTARSGLALGARTNGVEYCQVIEAMSSLPLSLSTVMLPTGRLSSTFSPSAPRTLRTMLVCQVSPKSR